MRRYWLRDGAGFLWGHRRNENTAQLCAVRAGSLSLEPPPWWGYHSSILLWRADRTQADVPALPAKRRQAGSPLRDVEPTPYPTICPSWVPQLPWPLPFDPGSVPGQYGSLDVRSKTVEEVYVEMLKPKDGVRLKVQYRPEDFSKVKGLPGDSFYIRCRCQGSQGLGARGGAFDGDCCWLMPLFSPQRVGPRSLLGPRTASHGGMLVT